MSKSHFQHLSKKWTDKHRNLQKSLWDKHGHLLQPHVDKLLTAPKQVAAGTLAGAMILAQPATASIATHTATLTQQTDAEPERPTYNRETLKQALAEVLPTEVHALSDEEKTKAGDILSEQFDVHAQWIEDGKQLNRAYGLIGAEQHLMRFPGDTMATHFDNKADAEKYYSSGMAPGRGAWGYFAPSRGAMTQTDVMREKYYIAVQTFLSPNWEGNVKEMYQFFKYKKMLVVNPENGKAVVAVIGDAGPAAWTGKSLGGSPEVMIHLERVDGRQKGPVLYYFLDDPENQIPLGPIEVK